MKSTDSWLGHIGNTPLYRLKNSFLSMAEGVWLKLEHLNPGGSIKDRVALAMIEDAERNGYLVHGSRIVEPTSGNTGIALAMICAAKGYQSTIVMPDNMSDERIRLMKHFGAELILTPASSGMSGAIQRARSLQTSSEKIWMPQQFENLANPIMHERTTAKEILRQHPEGFDMMFAGVGTGGHLTGVGRVLKKHFPEIKIIAVEPVGSAVISGNKSGIHGIQGLGAGFIPKNLDVSLIDEVIQVHDHDAISMMKKLAQQEGLATGISTGAVCAAIKMKLSGTDKKYRVLSFAYDRADRYLSMGL